MSQPPLFLKVYFVTNLSIKANPNANPSTPLQTGENTATTAVNIARHADNNNDWKVELKIKSFPVQKELLAYLVEIEMVGFFETNKDLDSNASGAIIATTGPSLLYGAARELVLLIT